MASYKGPMADWKIVSTAVVAADLTLDNGILKFGVPTASASQVICDFLDLIPGQCSITVAVAEALQTTTVTFTAANNTTYMLRLQQWDAANRVWITNVYAYTSAASGDTATTIGNAFRTQINADSRIHILAGGTATLMLYAEAGYPVFTATSIEPSTTTVVLNATGNPAVGTTAALALEGITEGVASAASYTRVRLRYNANGVPTNTLQTNQPYQLDLYINQASADYANTLAKFRYILAGRSTSITSAANPEAIAVL